MARNVQQDDIYNKQSRVRMSKELQLSCVYKIIMQLHFFFFPFQFRLLFFFPKKGRLPVKWTAYEALLFGTYTTQSDV